MPHLYSKSNSVFTAFLLPVFRQCTCPIAHGPPRCWWMDDCGITSKRKTNHPNGGGGEEHLAASRKRVQKPPHPHKLSVSWEMRDTVVLARTSVQLHSTEFRHVWRLMEIHKIILYDQHVLATCRYQDYIEKGKWSFYTSVKCKPQVKWPPSWEQTNQKIGHFLYCNYFNGISNVEISLNKVTHFLILGPIHMLLKNL